MIVGDDQPVREIGKEQFAPLVLGGGVVFRRGHDADHVVGHPPGRHHEADPAQDEDEKQFPRPQAPRGTVCLKQYIGSHNAQEKRDQEGEIDMGEGEVGVSKEVMARQRKNIDDHGQRQSQGHGPRCRYFLNGWGT